MLESSTTPTRAAIGEGDLPNGALAFQRVIMAQKEWKRFAEACERRKNEIDDAEVTQMKSYLKQLANEYYDMEVRIKVFSWCLYSIPHCNLTFGCFSFQMLFGYI